MKKNYLFVIGAAMMLAVSVSSCSSDEENSFSHENSEENEGSENKDSTTLQINISDYNVSNPICCTDGLTANYKSPSFFCKIDGSPGIESLYIHYRYYDSVENSNNFYIEQINVGDVLGLDSFMAELFYPFTGTGYERHTYVATSGTIKVIDKKGIGESLSFTLQFNDLTFTKTGFVESPQRDLLTPYIVNGIVTFKYTEKD